MFNQPTLTYDRIFALEGPPLAWPARVSTDPPIIVWPGLHSPPPQKPPASPGEEGQPSRSVLTSGASYSDWQEAALCALISSLSSQIIIFKEAEL